MKNSAAEQALKDIAKDFTGLRNTWYTPENRKLNRQLGISILNSGGARNKAA